MRNNFGVYTYVFRVKESIEITYKNIGSILYGKLGKIQDDRLQKSFYNKILIIYIENEIIFADIV